MNSIQDLIQNGLIWRGTGPEYTSYSQKESILSQIFRSKPNSNKSLLVAPFNISNIDQALPQGGLPFGNIHEWFYRGKADPGFNYPPLSILLSLVRNFYECSTTFQNPPPPNQKGLRRNVSTYLNGHPKFIIWIGAECWPTPFSIPDDLLPYCIFIDPPDRKLFLWSLINTLSSKAVSIVIAATHGLKLNTSRRLNLAAKQGGTIGFLIRPSKEIGILSSALTRWLVSPTPNKETKCAWNLELIKIKGHAPQKTTWDIELSDNKLLQMSNSLKLSELELCDATYQLPYQIGRSG